MPATPSLIGKKAAPKTAARSASVDPIRFWRVKEDRPIPRRGSGAFLLKKGKEISTPGAFDLKTLLSAGVDLEEIPAPAWYVDQQAEAREKHQAMLDAGHDVGPVPEPFVPTPLLKDSESSAAS